MTALTNEFHIISRSLQYFLNQITTPGGELIAALFVVWLSIVILVWRGYFKNRDYFLVNDIRPDHYQRYVDVIITFASAITIITAINQLIIIAIIAGVITAISLVIDFRAEVHIDQRLWKQKYPSLPYDTNHLTDKFVEIK